MIIKDMTRVGRTWSKGEKCIVLGIPILFLIGTMMHFLYEFSGKNALVGAIAAVNESLWEHEKMVLWPILCWWGIYYLLKGKRNDILKEKWFTSALICLAASLVAIPMLYYFYTQAFGVELLAVDISILFIAILIGQSLGLHYYQHGKGIKTFYSITIYAVILIIFIVFTFYPPHIPLFQDSSSGRYGI